MKKPWTSKTLWINAIALGAIAVQSQTGYLVTPEVQAAALTVINAVLRVVTKEPLDWSAPNPERER